MSNSTNKLFSTNKLAWLVFFVLAIACLGTIAVLAPERGPTRRGSSTEFWDIVCHVRLEEGEHIKGTPLILDADWVGYENSGPIGTLNIHGSELYIVPLERVLDDFPRVTEHLENALHHNEQALALDAYREWKAIVDKNHGDPIELIQLIKKRKEEAIKRAGAEYYCYHQMDEKRIRERWARRRRLLGNHHF